VRLDVAVDPKVAITLVHASRGKVARAEPVSALYEQGRVHHAGAFIELEDQMCSFAPGASKRPDRLDPTVYALTELMIAHGQNTGFLDYYKSMFGDRDASKETS